MRRNGFTLVELLVVIGVVAVLMGLVLFALRGARSNAEGVKSIAAVRTMGQALDMYCGDYRGVYPNSFGPPGPDGVYRPHASMWDDLLIDHGYFTRIPTEQLGGINFWHLSYTVQAHARHFTFDSTVRPSELPVSDVRQTDVLYPNLKGVLSPNGVETSVHLSRGGRRSQASIITDVHFWCCGDVAPEGPVWFADGNIEVGGYLDFAGGRDELVFRLGYGTPVLATWDGYRGIDREH